MRKFTIKSALGLLMLFAFGGQLEAQGAAFPLPQPRKAWTVLVYLSGDNNLDSYARNILARATRAGSSVDVNVVAQFDGKQPNDSQRLYLQSDSKGKSDSITLKSGVEYDMGSSRTLAEFVDWGIRNFPSERLALVVVAHGRGILNLPIEDGSFASGKKKVTLASSPDDTSGTHMDEEEMAARLSEVLGAAGRKIDLLLYNSCLMGNIEVMGALSKVARYAMASEYTICVSPDADLSTELGVGAPVEAVIRGLSGQPRISMEALGEIAMKQYEDSYRDFGLYHEAADQMEYCKSTFALFDLSYMSQVSRLLRGMVADFRAYRPSPKPAMEVLFDTFLKEPLVDSLGYTDLGIVSGRFCEMTGSPSACELAELLYRDRSFIVNRRLLHIDDLSRGAGVSIFFPAINAVDSQIREFADFYRQLDFTAQTDWGSLVLDFRGYLRDHRFAMLRNLVAEAQAGRLPQVRPTPDRDYNEYMLLLMASNAFRESLEKGGIEEASVYVEQIVSSPYRGGNMARHRADLKYAIEQAMESSPDANRRAQLRAMLEKLGS